MKPKLVALMSGGLDSFLSVVELKHEYDVLPLFVDYEHNAAEMELRAVEGQINLLELHSLQVVKVSNLSRLLTNNLTVEEQINDFYPSRNLLLLVIAAQVGVGIGSDHLVIGLNAGPRNFPDTSQEFIDAAGIVIGKTVGKNIQIHTPILGKTKRDEMLMLGELNIPVENFYFCQKGLTRSCNKCPSCIEMADAINWFSNN